MGILSGRSIIVALSDAVLIAESELGETIAFIIIGVHFTADVTQPVDHENLNINQWFFNIAT